MFPEPQEKPAHQSSLSLMLGFFTLGGFLLFMILISGGFFLYVLLSCFAVFAVGVLHYLMWGQSMHHQTEGEREEERAREEAEENRW